MEIYRQPPPPSHAAGDLTTAPVMMGFVTMASGRPSPSFTAHSVSGYLPFRPANYYDQQITMSTGVREISIRLHTSTDRRRRTETVEHISLSPVR